MTKAKHTCAWILRFDKRKPLSDQAVYCKREASVRVRHVGYTRAYTTSRDWYCIEHAHETQLLDALIAAGYAVLDRAERVNVKTSSPALRRALRKLNHAMLLIALEPPNEDRTRGNEARSRERRRRAKGRRARARK